MTDTLYLLASTGLFALGFTIVLIRKNIIVLLMGIELMLNAANINFVAFADSQSSMLEAQMMSLFVVVIAVAEAAVALAIVIQVVRSYQTSNVDEINELKG